MAEPPLIPDDAGEAGEGGLGRRIAHGTVAQQGAQVVAILVALAITTALGRNLTLAEFGVYGLITSLATYVFFALGSAEPVAVKTISGATDQPARDRAYTTALAVYAALGVAVGILLAGVGQLLLEPFDVGSDLMHQARLGVIAVGALTAVGFPLRLHQDLLRADQRFTLASAAESAGWLALGTTLLVLVLVIDAPLWALAAAGGAIPAFLGASALLVVRAAGLPYRVRPATLERGAIRTFLGATSYLLFSSASEVLITSLDRTVLALFRPASVVGLYEGAFRLNNAVRSFAGTLNVTILPVLARLAALEDRERGKELLVRGTRYLLAAVVPPTVALMVLADLVLTVWLGERYDAAGSAAVIFLAWWLLAPNLSVAIAVFVVESRYRWFAIYSWGVALVNLAASLALTPILGLEGVALGTTLGYLAGFPFFMRFMFSSNELSVPNFARVVWLPAYATGALLAAALLALRAFVDLHGAAEVLGIAALATLAGWVFFYAAWMTTEERALFRSFARRASPAKEGPSPARG